MGDIHGRADLLARLEDLIRHDLENSPPERSLILFLGDYVDRGPRSCEVVERLASTSLPGPVLALRGNHEAMLLSAVAHAGGMDYWCHNGGIETLHSYGVDVGEVMLGRGYERARDLLRDRLPDEHLAFLSDLPLTFEAGDYFFCHAGVRPGVPLDRQSEDDLLWIREEFLSSALDHGRFVVHGHSPVAEPEVRDNRINIDTGAFLTNHLTCLVLEGNSRKFLVT